MLCLNVGSWMIYTTTVVPQQLKAGMPISTGEEMMEAVQPENVMGYMNQTSTQVQLNVPILGDLWNALRLFVDTVYWLIWGFPRFLAMIGTPAIIQTMVIIPMFFAFSVLFIEFIFGRSISD